MSESSKNNNQQKCDICHIVSPSSNVLLIKNTQNQEYNICLNCLYILNDERKKMELKLNVSSGEKIVDINVMLEHLNKNVFGQTHVKEQLTSLIYMHYDNINKKNTKFKSNILLIGPTGSGKTLIVKEIASKLDIPFVQIDATTLTESGYVGSDVDICIEELLSVTNGDVTKAQRGIVFIDEIDKKNFKEVSNNRSKDIGGVGVQQALLKLIEGTTVYISGGNQAPNTRIAVNTDNILFIFAGAFPDLFDIISARLYGSGFAYTSNQKPKQIGNYQEVMKNVTTDDLCKYGMITEFVGRLPHVIVFDELTDENMLSILAQIIKFYEKSFINVEFHISKESSMHIIKTVRENKTGARGISFQIWKIISSYMLQLYTNKDQKMHIYIEIQNNQPVITNIISKSK